MKRICAILSCQDCTSSPKPPVVADMHLESPKHLQLPAFSKGMPSQGSPSPTGSQFQECVAEMGSLPGTVSENMFKATANSICPQPGVRMFLFLHCMQSRYYMHTHILYIYISNLHTVSCCAFTILEYLSGAPAHSVGTYTIETRNRNCASHCPQCERL